MATTFRKWYCIEYVVKTYDYTKFEIIPGENLQPFVTAQSEDQIRIGESVYFGAGSLDDLTMQARVFHIAAGKAKCKKEAAKKLACYECKAVNSKVKKCKGKCVAPFRQNKELNLWSDFNTRNHNILKNIHPNISLDRKMAVLLIFNKSHLIPCAFNRCQGCTTCNPRPAAAASLTNSPGSMRQKYLPQIGSSGFVGEFCTEVLYSNMKMFFKAKSRVEAETIINESVLTNLDSYRVLNERDINITLQRTELLRSPFGDLNFRLVLLIAVLYLIMAGVLIIRVNFYEARG